MPASLITHPFRIRISGRVAAAEQGTDAYVESQLAVIMGTRLGEREMCPTFGVPDVAFAYLSAADIQTCLDTFGPDDVEVTAVITEQVDDDTQAVTIEWEATES